MLSTPMADLSANPHTSGAETEAQNVYIAG